MARPSIAVILLGVAALAPLTVRGEDRSVEALCADLACEDTAAREAATEQLVGLGTAARGAVLCCWQGAEDPELRARAVDVLGGIDSKELISLLTGFDSRSEPRPLAPQEDSAECPRPAADVQALLQQVNSEEWREAEAALFRLNEIAKGAVLDAPALGQLHSAPTLLRRFIVLVGRDTLARGFSSWGRSIGDGASPAPPTLRPLGVEDVEALIGADAGKVTKSADNPLSVLRETEDGGVYAYRYSLEEPRFPLERIVPSGVVHQFTYDTASGALVLWRVDGIDAEWFEVQLVKGHVAALRTSSGLSVTFK